MLRRLQLSLFAVLLAAPFCARAEAVRSAAVVGVQATRVADLVLLGAGFDAGLREGMVCRVTREGAAVGEVLLVDLRRDRAAALILNLAAGQSIRAGDRADIKILTN